MVIKPASFAKRVAPKYPRSRQRKGHVGAVELSLMVDEADKQFDIVVLRSSHVGFEKPAVTAVAKYLYDPATKNDLPVIARDRVVVYYEIEGQGNTNIALNSCQTNPWTRLPVHYKYHLKRG